jgi:hypothetical protein
MSRQRSAKIHRFYLFSESTVTVYSNNTTSSWPLVT